MTPFFSGHFMRKDFIKDKKKLNQEGLADIFAKVLATVKDPNQPACSSVDLMKLEKSVGKTNPTFMGFGQQDAYEFFKGLLEGLNIELNRVRIPAPYKMLKVNSRLPLQTSVWFPLISLKFIYRVMNGGTIAFNEKTASSLISSVGRS